MVAEDEHSADSEHSRHFEIKPGLGVLSVGSLLESSVQVQVDQAAQARKLLRHDHELAEAEQECSTAAFFVAVLQLEQALCEDLANATIKAVKVFRLLA